MEGLDWSRLREYYYGRRKNRVPEDYYEGKFKRIKKYFRNNPITYDTIGGFFTWLDSEFERDNGKKMSNSYRNKFLSVLKVCAKLTGTNIDDYKGDNESFDRVPTEKLNVEEFKQLIATWLPYQYDSEYHNFLDVFIIKILAITTQRPSNIRFLTWNDYVHGYIHFRITKNGKPHKVYIPPHLQKDMQHLRKYGIYIFCYEERPFDLNNFNEMLIKRCQMAGILKHITAKSFRGTGITEYLRDGIPLHEVMKISNHQDPKVIINHYYDPQNKEIERRIENNPFDPEPLTKDKIIELCNEFISSLQKRDCQAVPIIQNKNYILTIPLEI